MPTAYCPWCTLEIDARLAVELKVEHDQLRRRADAADQVADSVWSMADAVRRFLREFRREWDKDEGDLDETRIEHLLDSLSESLSELSEAKGAFAAASRSRSHLSE
jgi:hypothetical protein